MFKTNFNDIYFNKNLGLTCGENEVYDVRAECPKTCLNPVDYDCGEKVTMEECFCKEGYLRNSQGVCITADKCGCTMPDKSSTLQVNMK